MTWPQQLLKFVGIGGVCTLLQYLILLVLTEFASIHPTISSSIGYSLSAVVNYWANKRITFNSNASHTRALPKFVFVVIIGLLLNGVVLEFFHETMKIHYLPSQVIATIIVLFWNFGASKFWTFSEIRK